MTYCRERIHPLQLFILNKCVPSLAITLVLSTLMSRLYNDVYSGRKMVVVVIVTFIIMSS